MAFAVCLLGATTASAADTIYWGTQTAVRTGSLTGGTGSTLFADSGFPTGEGIDIASGKIYWVDQNSGAIGVGNLDGSGSAQNLFTGESAPIGNIGIDPAAGKLYWTDFSSGLIRVGNLNGSGTPQTLFSGESGPIGVAIDPASGKLYWADYNSGLIRVGNLDGSGTPQTLFSGESEAYGVAIDTAAGKIYWAVQTGAVRVGNLNGTGTPQSLFSGEGVTSGVALDPSAAKIYWGTQADIRAGNSDGTGAQTLFSGESVPVSPVLLRGPQGTGGPTISGASATGSTLSCSQGSWAPDLAGAFLYREPRSFSYSWQLNGSPISGTSSTVTASSPGNYTCTVTATNQAGSAAQTSAAFAVSTPVNPPPTTNKPPHVTITSERVSQAKHTATFRFKATRGATGFKCALVKQTQARHKPKVTFRTCSSGKTYKNLAVGSYTFEVKATSAAGTGPVATRTFKIKPAPKPKPPPSGESEGTTDTATDAAVAVAIASIGRTVGVLSP